jgi:hypothetical protein
MQEKEKREGSKSTMQQRRPPPTPGIRNRETVRSIWCRTVTPPSREAGTHPWWQNEYRKTAGI